MSDNQPVTADITDANPVLDAADDAIGAAYDRLVTNNGSDRGDGGQFKSPNGEAESAGVADEAGAGAVIEAPAVAETPAPAHLPQSIKTLWPSMTEDARKAWSSHVTETDRKFGEVGKQLGQIKPFHDEFAAAMSKYPEFKALPPAELAQRAVRLAAVQVELQRNPVGTILDIARQSGALDKLAEVFQGKSPSGDQGHLVARLEREVSELKSQLGKAADPETIRETVSHTMAEKAAEANLDSWAKAREHYEEVKADLPYYVAKVIESKGRERPHQDTLDDAYDMAINANPAVRAKIRAAEAKATAAQTDPKRTDQARKAASINVKPSANGKDRPMTEDEAMASAYDRMMAAT